MMEDGKITSRRPSFIVALLPLIAMGLLLGVGYGIYKIRPQVLLVVAAFLTGCLGFLLHFSWKDMERGIVDSIHKAMPAILIMLTVGILIGSWMASGTIPMIIYYGLKLISPKFFLVTACLVCSITALATGTSWGTIGTVGVAFIGIAMGLGIPLGMAAGAIVAGAYFGDKMSPFSDIPNLAAVTAGANLFDHIKHMMWSAVPGWLLSLVIYFFVGLKYGGRLDRIRHHDPHPRTRSRKISALMSCSSCRCSSSSIWLSPRGRRSRACSSPRLSPPFWPSIFQKASSSRSPQAVNTGYPAHTGVEVVDKLSTRAV